MTPDEVRKLVGGYATGSLSEAERKVLFQAALEDQELFDELAGEQVLKELLDEPGARQRLLAALESGPHRAGWWMRPWPWTAAAVTVAIAISIVVSLRTQPPPVPQVAQVMKSPEQVGPLPPPPPPARSLRKAAPAAVPQEPPSQPKSDAIAEVRQEQLADKLEAAAQPQAAVAPQVSAFAKGGARGFVAPAAAPPPPVRSAENLTVNAGTAFAFTYAVRPDGFLEIVPTAGGYLSVTAWDQDQFSRPFVGAVTAGMPVRIKIPPDAMRLMVSFFRLPGGTGSPVRRDETSGTVTDQDPPNGRIVIELFLTPAPR